MIKLGEAGQKVSGNHEHYFQNMDNPLTVKQGWQQLLSCWVNSLNENIWCVFILFSPLQISCFINELFLLAEYVQDNSLKQLTFRFRMYYKSVLIL